MEIAERFYVLDQMQLKDIARKIEVSEKTVQRWKVKFDWENKRKQFLASKQMFHEELFVFARKIMQSIQFALTKMIPLVLKLKSYEDVVSKDNSESTVKELTPDFIKEINEQFLGIKYEE